MRFHHTEKLRLHIIKWYSDKLNMTQLFSSSCVSTVCMPGWLSNFEKENESILNMAPLFTRRLANVETAKQIVEAVMSIRQQKQIPNLERITRFLQRYGESAQDKMQEQINNAVHDGFIVEYTAVGVKGQRTGLEQMGYRLSSAEDSAEEDDGHDWYCFECHQPGDVFECSDCFRVFHQGCTRECGSRERFTCSICMISKLRSGMKRKTINTLLSYTMTRMKEKTRELYKLGRLLENHDNIFKKFVYRSMDINQMEIKVHTSQYRTPEEFYGDAQTILHNCVLIFGEQKGNLAELALVMVQDCKRELEELELCPKCYYLSNEKPQDWFCQPCDPPHELVYARQTGYGYWPAKLVQDLGDKLDVRFFGGWHQRALIPQESVKPITTDLKKLPIKYSAGFQKAMAELKKYQENLKTKENCKSVDFDTDSDGGLDSNVSQSIVKFNSDTEDKAEVKKKRKSKGGEEQELNEELSNRHVSSTSVDKYCSKKARRLSQIKHPDETSTVTSTIDKVMNVSLTPSASTAVQTDSVQSEEVSIQTDMNQGPQGTQGLIDEARCRLWQEKIDQRLATLKNQLQQKFEEEKQAALRALTHQMELDFGQDKQQAVERTLASMKVEVDKARLLGEEKARENYMEEMKKLAAMHKEAITQVKKKQWCQCCGKEAIYHCCWNTSYCSVPCQQAHWHSEHKRFCRRKRS